MEGLLLLDCLQWVVVKKSVEGGLVMEELTAELTFFLSPSHLLDPSYKCARRHGMAWAGVQTAEVEVDACESVGEKGGLHVRRGSRGRPTYNQCTHFDLRMLMRV